MELFHGSTLVIEQPRIINRFTTLDFGTGFYTTANEMQAREFARKTFARRGRKGAPTVSVYRFDDAAARSSLRFLEFHVPDRDWLEFVVHNRREGRDPSLNVDIISGPVANDDVFQTIALYESGQLNADEAVTRFKVKRLFNQILFCSERALRCLEFLRSYIMEERAG